ncbi:MAG: hypothetical protein NWF00_11975 [Candidatus Bathyarchaeota archaeon]|nr:hypothetical protein [Candidatus Bathyarchaeota archaeon]
MNAKDKKLEELLAKHDALDNNCRQIFLTLLAYKSLRHNELMRTLKKLGIKMERPTLDSHLKHLVDSGLAEVKTAFQFSSYTINKDVKTFLGPLSQEEVQKWLEKRNEFVPKYLQVTKFDRKEHFKKLTDNQLEKMVGNDLKNVLESNLYELKNLVEYDLNLSKFDDDSAFWKFIGNPIYRMHEKSLVEKCRDSPEYKKKLFSKIELMMKEFRSK